MAKRQEKNGYKSSVILTVRVDYTHDGNNERHAHTAARMAVRDNFHTIDNGVEVKRVGGVHPDGGGVGGTGADPGRAYGLRRKAFPVQVWRGKDTTRRVTPIS